MRSRGFISRACGPGLRYARPPRRLLTRPFKDGLRPFFIPRRRAGGEAAGQAPRSFFSAFLPGSCQRSKKNPQSRVHSAALRRSAALDGGAAFFAFRARTFRPEGGQYGR